MNVFNKQKGFTLIEIVVVIAIMGILSTIIYSSFDASRAKSRDQKRVSDISAIQLALEQYFQKNGVYPIGLSTLTTKPSASTSAYISEIPKDPSTGLIYTNYFPISKIPGPDNSNSCISYQLWTRFEKSNSWLDSKKGFNSVPLASGGTVNGLYECVKPAQNHYGARIDASSTVNALVYDVMP